MNILTFFAHPDDETMFNGGTLALLAEAGAAVHYLCATRGEGGERGDPPLCEPDVLGKFREAELACAVEKLGGCSLAFLDYEDPRVGPEEELFTFTQDMGALTKAIIRTIDRLQIEAVITHGSNGEYGHPAHLTCHAAVVEALDGMPAGARPVCYTFSPIFERHPYPRLTNKDDSADLVLDITPALGQKVASALCHKTQHALFVRRRSKEAGRQLSVPEVILSLESLHRYSQENEGTARFEAILAPYRV